MSRRGPSRGWRWRGPGWLAAGTAAAAAALLVWVQLPLPAAVSDPAPVPSVELQDRFGVPLRRVRAPDGARGGWIPIEQVDPKVIQAFVAIEDHRFFDHRGVDVTAALRALRDNVRRGRRVSGASTLTMQTARLLLGMNRGWSGKARQVLWALRMDAHLDKERILEIYLNRVPLGQGTVGVRAASELYFGVPPSRLSLGQAALLAGLARAPSSTNPFVSRVRARDRRSVVLARMQALGMASGPALVLAADEPDGVEAPATRFSAPHFTSRLLAQTGADLGTGTLRTTLDIALQRAVEDEVRHAIRTLERQGAEQAAVVVLDNRTGDVLAWVGSPDFFADSLGQVDMVVSRRQPGSALKPFLYGLALESGYSAATVLPDLPTTYATPTGPYAPRNYDRRFRGPVRLREALASSYNVPAVELAQHIGVAPFLGVLQAAGFASLDRSADHYGLGLALGNGEVTLLELANAYRGLANGGSLRPVRRLLGSDAQLERSQVGFAARTRAAPVEGHRFLSAPAAALVLDILSDPVARAGGFGTETVLEFPFPVAAKTGTSRHFTDNWAVATTEATTVAVWVGNFRGNPMKSVSGITGAGPLLHRVVLQTAQRYPPGVLPSPVVAGAEVHRVCALSGMKAHAGCPSLLEWFLPGTAPTRIDDWQSEGRTRLPPEYAEWAAGQEAEVAGQDDLPQRLAEGTPRIVSPLAGDVYEFPPAVDPRYATVPLVATHAGATWSVDGQPHGGQRWRIRPGTHWIAAAWPSGARDSVQVTVR